MENHNEQGLTLLEDLTAELTEMGVAAPATVIEEFNLLAISDEAEDLPREIAKKAVDRIDGYARLVEDLLQPDTSLSTLNECGFFSEEQLQGIARTYRQLMAIVRSHTVADLDATKESYRAFIVDALAKWAKIKPTLQETAKRLQQGWKENQPLHRERGYFG